MDKEERIHLLRTLAEASNAFHDVLKKHGYNVSYGLSDLCRTGNIRKVDEKPWESRILGDLTIEWKLKNDYKGNGVHNMENIVYTHDEASRIVELFESVLEKNGITIPSPEDDERDPDNGASLYGSVYSDLLDNVENSLIEMLNKAEHPIVVPYVYSGKY